MVRAGYFSFRSPMWEQVSDDAKELIRSLMNTNPKLRATPEQALGHKWFSILEGKDRKSSALGPELLDNLKARTRPGQECGVYVWGISGRMAAQAPSELDQTNLPARASYNTRGCISLSPCLYPSLDMFILLLFPLSFSAPSSFSCLSPFVFL